MLCVNCKLSLILLISHVSYYSCSSFTVFYNFLIQQYVYSIKNVSVCSFYNKVGQPMLINLWPTLRLHADRIRRHITSRYVGNFFDKSTQITNRPCNVNNLLLLKIFMPTYALYSLKLFIPI